MEYRNFGKSTDKVSLLGFGCMRLPVKGKEAAEIDYDSAFEMVDYAISRGINYFDTAYMYHDGKSELFVAEALKKYPRESFFLADKLPLWSVEKEEDVDRVFNEQLNKCAVDYFDYYLMHAMAKERFDKAKRLGVYDKLKEYQRQGRIRHLGFSFHDSPEVLKLMLDTYDWDFVQIQLNYLDWELQNAKKQYELIEEKGIQCIVMEPVRGGALATLCPEANKILRAFSPDQSIASWAIRYAATFSNVLTVLSGMSNMSQIEDNINNMSPFLPLSDEEQRVLSNALEVYKKTKTVPCTGCRYCMDCPSGVDIPHVLNLMNEYTLTRDKFYSSLSLKSLESNKHPEHCIDCGLCAPLCPQSIDIPEQMKKAAELFKELTKQ